MILLLFGVNLINNKFENKNILFIGIGFYDYEYAIKGKLESYGSKVTYFSSVKRTFYNRFLRKLKLNTLEERTYHKDIQRKIQEQKNKKFDYVFIIKAEYIIIQNMIDLHTLFRGAQFILYLWDSIERNPSILELKDYFHSIYTFDNNDSKQYKLKLRPLFYRSNFLESKTQKKIYDITFIGWAHSDRIKYLLKLRNYLIKYNKTFCFKILTGRFMYLSLLLKKKITNKDRDIFIFKNLNYDKYRKILCKSKSVLDIHHPNQNGLTIRTIEAFASGCFLYTTNENIKNYNDISTELYECINRDDIFMVRDDYPLNINLSEYYSIDHFLNDLFFCDKDEYEEN